MVDFCYIGPSRAGSTWFYVNMNKHPQVEFPLGKITHFWDEHYKGGHVYKRKYEKRSVEWYLEKHKPKYNKKIGDVTESYAVMDKDKIKAFYDNCPNTKLFYCLRNPMDISWSACKLVAPRHLGNINNACFDEIIEYILGKWDMCSTKAYEYKNCDLVENIKKWISIFPENNFYVYYFDKISTKPKLLLKEMSDFINIERTHWDKINEKELKQYVNESKNISIRQDVKDFITETFMPKIEELEKFTGNDLSHWKEKWQ